MRDPKKPNLAVLYASVGSGHGRAAQAVARALQELAPFADVVVLDVLDLTNAAFRHLYGKAYFQLFARAPHLIGYLYEWLDRDPGSDRSVGDKFRQLVERVNLRRFQAFLTSTPWDLVINTHFLPAEIVAVLRRRGEISVPQITVTTDFEAHRLWVNEPTEHYFAATPEARAYLRYWGVPPERISVSGIPIDPAFVVPADKAAARARLGVAPDRPLVLQMAGGVGVGPIDAVFRALLAIRLPLSVAVIAGRNENARAALSRIAVPARHQARLLGFTEDMDQWMAAADLVISKPGGLTSSECLARGVPLAIVHPIPGQESRNSDYLLEAGAAVRINTLPTLSHKLARLLFDRDRLRTLSDNARRAARPWAAFDVAQKALAILSKGTVGVLS